MNRPLLANLAAAVAALGAGASVAATRFVVGETDPLTLAFYRYFLAAICMAPALWVLRPRSRLAAAEIGKIALLGLLFFGFFPWAFNSALNYTTAARGAIGLATIPIQTLLLAALLGREELTLAKLAGFALAFAGIAIVFGPEAMKVTGSGYLIGDGFMLLAAFSGAIYSIFSRETSSRHGALFVTALAMVFGALALFPLALAGGSAGQLPRFTREGWLAVLFLGTFGGAIQFSLYTWAIKWLSPARAAIYLTLNPISAMLLAVLLLGERLTLALILGLAFVLAGILTTNSQALRTRRTKARRD